MLTKLKSILIKVYNHSLRNFEYKENEGLPYWREKIYNGLILVLLVFGTIIIVPNQIAAISDGIVLMSISNFAMYFFVLFLFFYRKIKLKHRVTLLLLMNYLMSVMLLVYLGPKGPGFVWLAGGSLIAALLLGLRASIITILINILIIIVLAILINAGIFNTIFFEAYTPLTWVAVSSNIILINSITSIPLALLLNALENSNKAENELRIELLNNNKQLEVEKENAQKADRLKSAFLANLSHDLRTPMNAIMGFSELIHNECKNSDTKLYSNQILQNSSYLKNLIDDIVDISLIESGQISFNYSNSSIDNLIEEITPMVNSIPQLSNKANLIIKYPEKTEFTKKELFIDVVHVKQVLTNLISNAVKYTQDGIIEISAEEKNGNIKFEVSDTGIGIPYDEQHKIFHRFSKIQRNANLSVQGIGLGLSICKALVDAMNGTITFESEENKGTVFIFIIPYYLNT